MGLEYLSTTEDPGGLEENTECEQWEEKYTRIHPSRSHEETKMGRCVRSAV
jgi:hypothetical protein